MKQSRQRASSPIHSEYNASVHDYTSLHARYSGGMQAPSIHARSRHTSLAEDTDPLPLPYFLLAISRWRAWPTALGPRPLNL